MNKVYEKYAATPNVDVNEMGKAVFELETNFLMVARKLKGTKYELQVDGDFLHDAFSRGFKIFKMFRILATPKAR